MTDTIERTETTLTITDPEALVRVIGNALLFTGTEAHLPMLTNVHFEYDTGRIEVTTTDRYRIHVDEVEATAAVERCGPVVWLLPATAAKALAATIKAQYKPRSYGADAVTIRLFDDNRGLAVKIGESFGAQWPLYVDDNTVEFFATVHRKYPINVITPGPVEALGFTAAYLLDLGKVKPGVKPARVAFHFQGGTLERSGLPVIAKFLGGPTVLTVPCSIKGEDS